MHDKTGEQLPNAKTGNVCEVCGKISSTPMNICFECFKELREEDWSVWN